MIARSARLTILTVSLVLAAAASLSYLPGLSGPFVFDDFTNLVNNDFVKIRTLDAHALYHAAYSLQAGPLQRPVAMLSFALNYYAAGTFADPTPYKLTNLAVHLINGLLIFWLMRLIFQRATASGPSSAVRAESELRCTLLAGAVALLWIVHPIQLTSVLYVVQRMTQLAALFTALGLILYLKGRLRLLSGDRTGVWLMLLGVAGCGVLGVLSKENAVLLPLFVLVLELTLFPSESPWCSVSALTTGKKWLLTLTIAGVALLALAAAVNYALPGYSHRPFTMIERVMTEWRVLAFYLGLILVPRLQALGLQHDDIAISTSLYTPWTTPLSLLVLIALVTLAIYARRRSPLLSLGILWFFTAHLLESTLFNLEIAHEHRNYLASLGPFIVVVHLIDVGYRKLRDRRIWALVPVIALVFAVTTAARAKQWSSPGKLAGYEALHHPGSPRAQAQLGSFLLEQGHHEQALQAVRRAADLDPEEAGYLIMLQYMAAQTGAALDADVEEALLNRLRTSRNSTLSDVVLQFIGSCIHTSCRALREPMERWLRAILTSRLSADKSFYYNLLGRVLVAQGRTAAAIDAFQRSYREDPVYVHPLFELANLYIGLGRLDDAAAILDQLRQVNTKSPHPRDHEIEQLASTIDTMRIETKDTVRTP